MEASGHDADAAATLALDAALAELEETVGDREFVAELIGDFLVHACTFLGDGVLAIFGAPIPVPDHADRALAAARVMLAERLPRFNEWVRAEGFDGGFCMGVGLNSGSVMSGNVGSERRLEYTAIGDTVNTTSRIEQLTKEYRYGALLSDTTRGLLTLPADDLTFLGDVTIRGRATPAALWGLGAT